MIDIIQSDAVEWAHDYEGSLFHALLCDPPYHLTSITKRFGKEGSAPAQFGTDGAFSRASKGFMGKTWDGGDVAFRPETWYAFMRILHPGAFGMAFASARGWHRLACAIEDAGFIIHPMIGWVYGSGFPKATRIDTQIDREAGAKREVVREESDGSGRRNRVNKEMGFRPNVYSSGDLDKFPVTAPATELAKAWAGHRYGLQALKPALEPIIVFQKPYEGRPLDCMTRTGAGAINIDGGRIETDDKLNHGGNLVTNSGDERTGKALGMFQPDTPNLYEQSPLGRWPANIVLDEEAGKRLDEQSGHLKSGHMGPEHQRGETADDYQSPHGIYGKFNNNTPLNETIGDEGGASRFFYRVQDLIEENDPIYYCSKSSKDERDAGCEKIPKSGGHLASREGGGGGWKADAKDNPNLPRHNNHPTVKPIDLARYLSTLLLPPAMYSPRRLFVPFAGVASECIGAFQAGWEEIVGIEMEEEYIPLARARAEYWQGKGFQPKLV